MNFDEFWDASWHLNSHKNRSQEALKKECQIVSILDLIFGRLRGFQEDLGAGAVDRREISGPLRSFRGKQVSVGKEEVQQTIRNAVRARRGGGY